MIALIVFGIACWMFGVLSAVLIGATLSSLDRK